ncbi:hypothetical protein FACS189413_06920 [Bacteroidia bacterium]|nr:hypothetical protein FACS189413_06920 [Bacteroidia bacterium]
MKKIFFSYFLFFLFSSCSFESSRIVRYQVNEPVIVSASEFRNSIKRSAPQKLTTIGKMCFYDGYLYISNPEKGIHVIDNTHPEAPKMLAYIEVLGNSDLCVYNGRLYANAWVDLVWFDISNPADPVLEGRLADAFPAVLPPVPNDYPCDYELYSMAQQSGKIVVGWNLQTRERRETSSWGDYLDDATTAPTFSGGNGVSGSMSRFGLVDHYLYAVIQSEMRVLDLSSEQPVFQSDNKIYISDVETIFPYKNILFLGTPYGMLIYSLENPLNPTFASQISHLYGCDPVVVADDLAYVTIRSGNRCGQTNNELLVIDVSDIKNPHQLASYSMHNPKGLGIDQGCLFLCDDGLKVFRLTEPQTFMANEIAHFSGMDGYDVIPYNSVLMMIADDGLYQYDYSSLDVSSGRKIQLLSVIPINK